MNGVHLWFRSTNRRPTKAAAPLGSPGWRPLQWLCSTMGIYHSSRYTPSVSPFGLTAPSEREPRRLRRWREAKSLPYGCRENRKRMPFNLLSL